MKIDDIACSVLKKIKPTDNEKRKLNILVNRALDITNKISKLFKGNAIIVGSFSRDTWLRNKKEFDLFIMFSDEIEKDRLEEYGLHIGKSVIKKLGGKAEISYAEHPYVRGIIGEFLVDIVPCYDMTSSGKIRSSVDRSPLHVKYLKKCLNKELSEQVLLLKQFCNAQNIYGANFPVQGFSGYLCELLIVKYMSFEEVLKDSINWKSGKIIDIENLYEDRNIIKKKFKNEILRVIDPIDSNRNVSAAISSENFFLFKKKSADFLKNPSESFFYRKKIKELNVKEFKRKIDKRKMEIIIIKFKKPNVVDEIFYSQFKKFCKRLDNILMEYEFKVFKNDYIIDENICYALFEMEISELPEIEKRIGPNVFSIHSCEDFFRRYENEENVINGPIIENNNLVFEINRTWKSARKKLNDTLKQEYNILIEKGIPSHIATEISNKFSILSTNQIYTLIEKNKHFAKFLRAFFEPEKLR